MAAVTPGRSAGPAARRDRAEPDPIGERAAIQAGLTHDKVPVLDPAAAPLGTDEEAGGSRTLSGADPAWRTGHASAALPHQPGAAAPETPGRAAARRLPIVLAIGGIVVIVALLLWLLPVA